MKNLKTLLLFNKFFICLIIFIFVYVFICINIPRSSKYDGGESILEGIVTSLSLNGSKLSMEINGLESVVVSYYIKTETEKNEIFDKMHLGDKIILNGEFKKPINNTIPNTFNYKSYLENHGIFYTFTANSYEVIDSGNIFYSLKDFFLKRAYSMDNSDYFLVFLLGDKALMDSADMENYQINGVSHLLAISGMHIGDLLGVLSLFLRKLSDKKSFVIISTVLLLFAFITSFAASIQRAVIFYIINRLNKFFGWRFKNFHVLLLTASVILLINPFMIYDLGFIYSFGVCAGIILYQDKLNGNYFVSLFKLSMISFLFSLPISICVNYEINLSSIFVNLIFVPWVSLIVYPFSLIAFIFSFLNPVFGVLIDFTNFLNNLFVKFSFMVNIPKSSFAFIIILYIYLVFAKNKKVLWGIFAITLVIMKIMPWFDNNYYVYYLDVGQGDCAVLIGPRRSEVVMIDTGGKISMKKDPWEESSKKYNTSDNTIKFLKSIGITNLDYLILSHGDADHAGEALNIIDKLKIKNIVINKGKINYLEEKIIDKSNIVNNYKLKYFDIINLNNKDYSDENKNSIVNLVKFLDYNLLFMGDASVETEEDILKNYKLPRIDILKLGHHGSRTSSCKVFIDTINPKYSLISVGKNNRYGHPNKEVLDNIKDSTIYRTDLDGSVMFKLKNNKLEIKTYAP